ncbi:NAD(P)H-dependent flavin oxidoreductase [Siminovitchia sp. 179-K 8D1 HS]|uniref:NAD(P)H-dependent flavin oxidoreductase n=1 Tax=Siminovitchia sp. 179-K 8D1 HS TaxID=3142385 RepID=UPI0039A368DB
MKQACEILSIKYPIIQGGMGNISNAILVAAVSNAGGLGTIGCGTMAPGAIEQIIMETKKRTAQPFALNIALTVSEYVDDIIRLAIKHQVSAVTLSAGNPAPYIPILKQNGIRIIVVVASVLHAKKAEKAGADILVAEGYEAAGINSSLELTTFTLIPQIVKKVKIPVFAAGGIGDGKGLAAALMLGASGVQIGTRLIATAEAPFHQTYKEKLLKANGEDTIVLGRPYGRVRRVLKGEYAEGLADLEQRGMTFREFQQKTSETYHIKGAIDGDFQHGYVNSGQVAGLIDDVPSVKQLIESMMRDARLQISKIAENFRFD